MNENEDLPAKKKPVVVNPTAVVLVDDASESDGQAVAEVIDLTEPSSFSFSRRALNPDVTMCRRLRPTRHSSSASSSRHAQSINASFPRRDKTTKNNSISSDICNILDLTGPPRESPVKRTPPHSAPRTRIKLNGTPERPPRPNPPPPCVQLSSSSSSSAASSGSLCELPNNDEDVVVTRVERYALPERLVSPDFKKLMRQCRYTETDWLQGTQNRVKWLCEENRRKAEPLQTIVKECEDSRKAHDDWLSQQTLRLLHLSRKLPTPVEEPFIDFEVEEEEETVLPPVTDDMRRRIKSALASRPDAILSDAFRLQVTTSELATLRPREWLSDMIINFYMQLIAERSGKNDLPSAHPMTTFFYPKLLQSGYAGVQRWTRRVDIFAHDLVLVPVHLGMHWCFALINVKEKKISYFDSMQSPNNECLSQLLQYLVDEAKAKKSMTLNVSEWSVENAKNIPKQTNGYDCGVFTCQFAEFLSRGAPLTFAQDKMVYFRERMMFEILEKRLLL